MDLIERDQELATLHDALEAAATGAGRVVLLHGEAGIGKTSVLRAFAEAHEPSARWLIGLCDDLATPRVLGPLQDLLPGVGPDLGAALAQAGGPDVVAPLLVDELRRSPTPVVLAVEDVHWADEATLDVLQVVARRIETLPAVVVLTYRTEEIEPDHPLRPLLAALPSGATIRIELPPLSSAAVRTLAGPDADSVYQLTGGNPFFVTELVAAGDALPTSVTDAVLARTSRLPDDDQRLLGLVSLVPGRAEIWLLDALLPGWVSDSVEPERLGLIRLLPRSVTFRHEIARSAVAGAMPAGEARKWHQRLAELLADQGEDPARVVHHAAACGDDHLLVTYGLLAGRDAAARSATHEALGHFRRLAALGDRLPTEVRLDVEEGLHDAALASGFIAEARDALDRALDVARARDDVLAQSRLLGLISLADWVNGNRRLAEEAAAEALRVLEGLTGTPEHARAVALRSLNDLGASRFDEAIRHGELALHLAEEADDPYALSMALTVTGTATLALGLRDTSAVDRAAEVARAAGQHEKVCIAYANVVEVGVDQHDHELAERYLRLGEGYAKEHEVHSVGGYLSGLRSRLLADSCRWEEAQHLARATLTANAHSPVNRLNPLLALATLAVRRADDDATDALASFEEGAARADEVQRLVPAALLAAEHAWLSGGTESLTLHVPRLGGLLGRLREFGEPWWSGELALWLHRAGALSDPPTTVPAPIRCELEGRPHEAERAWAALGTPYHAALALAQSTDRCELEAAVRALDDLGAKPAAARARAALRALGVRSVPRGPRASTREHPAGLTARQVDVLHLLADGATNQEIADRLVLSVRTVDHHVAAILMKLGVTGRREAVDQARVLGLVD